jgi:TolB-like protein
LEAAEKLRLVHRDLKPANLMLADGPGIDVKVIDFGLAKIIGAAQEGANKITHDGFVGTPAFASPEQFLGSPIDHRSDYFSLGATLFYLLTLDLPFKPGQIGGIEAQTNAGSHALDKLKSVAMPLPVIELISSLLAADPEGRPQTGKALNEAIHECQSKVAGSSLIAMPQKQEPASGSQTSGNDIGAVKPSGTERARRPTSKIKLDSGFEETGRLYTPQSVLWRVRSVMSMKWAVGLALGLLILSGLVFLGYREVFPAKPDAVRPDKSVAVLPFANISANKDDAYFADGIHDEVLNNLARISQLKVISRTSVMRYAADPKRDLREIAHSLGATAIVEGTVLREADRVRINVELIDPQTDLTIWADSYDRDLTSIFAIQSEIAQAVAVKLAAKLLPVEKTLLSLKPTQNMAAYDLYLKAQELIRENDISGNDFDERSSQAIALLEQAIQIDPQFALAYNSIGHADDFLYITFDQSPERRASADKAFETALRLAPDLPEVQLNYAYHLYYCYRD